jgi:hypothetical protein
MIRRLASPPVLAFLATRLLLLIVVALALRLFPTHTILDWQIDAFPGNNWLNGWLRWDAMWYESLVDSSARALAPHHAGANFFPLYAVVSAIAATPFRLWLPSDKAYYIGALLVSHVAFVTGLVAVFEMATDRVGTAAAERTVWLIACFPFSFFFSAAYSDALYFCLAAWMFRFCDGGHRRAAAVCVSFALFVRVPGVSLLPPLVVEFLVAERWKWQSLTKQPLAVALVAIAVIGVPASFWVRYGSPIAFVYAREAGWGRAAGLAAFAHDWQEFTAGPLACGSLRSCLQDWDLTRHLLGYWYALLLPLTLALAWCERRTIGVAQTLWVVVSIALAIPNGLDGMGRFTVVLFPIFIAASRLVSNRRALAAAAAVMLPFLLLFACQFARWRPVL